MEKNIRMRKEIYEKFVYKVKEKYPKKAFGYFLAHIRK